jgi:hypothetical protein
MKTTTDWTQAVKTFLDAQTAPTTIMKVAAALGTNADTLSADEYNFIARTMHRAGYRKRTVWMRADMEAAA